MRQKTRLALAAMAALLLHLLVLLTPGVPREMPPAPLPVEVSLALPAGRPALSPPAAPPSEAPATPFPAFEPSALPSSRYEALATPAAPVASARQEKGAVSGHAADSFTGGAVAAGPVAAPSRPPLCTRDPRPQLPALSRSLGEEGSVRLRLVIGAEGDIRSVTVVRSSGYARLDEAARQTLRQWRCHPAIRLGEPAAAELDETVVFELK